MCNFFTARKSSITAGRPNHPLVTFYRSVKRGIMGGVSRKLHPKSWTQTNDKGTVLLKSRYNIFAVSGAENPLFDQSRYNQSDFTTAHKRASA